MTAIYTPREILLKDTPNGVTIAHSTSSASIFAACPCTDVGEMLYWDDAGSRWYCSGCKKKYPEVSKNAHESAVVLGILTRKWISLWTGYAEADISIKVESYDG